MILAGFTIEQQELYASYRYLYRAYRSYPDGDTVSVQQAKRERLRRVVARRTGVLDARAPLMQCGQCPVFRCKFR